MRRSIPAVVAALAGAASLIPARLAAHPVHGTVTGLTDGLLHPFHGADHVLAVMAVGILAATAGGRRGILAPAAFVGAMLAGWALALTGISALAWETALVVSVAVLGFLIMRRDAGFGIAVFGVVAGLGFLHGQAHGVELGAAGVTSGFGLAIATAALHALGFLVARTVRSLGPADAIRLAGAGLVLASFVLVAL